MQDRQRIFDVIVVGSGASGGWAAKRLAEAGIKVALVEAGRKQSDENFREHTARFELPYRDMSKPFLRKTHPIQAQCYACTEYNHDWYCNDLEEPYTTPADKPFLWLGRTRVTGGRTNVWGRLCPRWNAQDMKPASFDGYGEDWPLSYKDLEPYYDLVEEYVGITGMMEGLEVLPDGKFLPPFPLTCQETMMRNRIKEKLGLTLTLGRVAVLTKAINGRADCHYCGPCERGCMTHSYFNAAFTTVADALQSGNCTLFSDAMAYKVLMDAETNRATGILYIDRNTRQPQELYAKVVILCAQAQESVRILLNSATRQYPNGLANSSGVLGHYLMAHVRSAGGTGDFPLYDARPTLNGPVRPGGTYIPRFRNLDGKTKSRDFLRGYGYEVYPSVDFNWSAPGFGNAYKQALLQGQASMSLRGWGEMLPRWDNYVELDPVVKDIYGIPVVRIHMSDSTNEEAMLKDIANSAGTILEAAGAKNIKTFASPSAPRWGIHESGIARMGSNPKTSVLNQFQQSHDIRNLFVMDSSGFTTNPCPNPALSIMALCVRSCDYLLSEMRKNNV